MANDVVGFRSRVSSIRQQKTVFQKLRTATPALGFGLSHPLDPDYRAARLLLGHDHLPCLLCPS